MVKTRGVKNALPPCLLEDLAKLEIKEDKELWEEEQGAHLSELKTTFTDIPPEILPHIIEYLDDLRDIYNVSMTTKAFRASVHDVAIVRACAFNGSDGRGKKRFALICSALMEQIQRGSIRPPSTFRLLRLVAACRCELRDNCLGYNRTTKLSAVLEGPAKSNRAFGLALCKMCLSQHTTKIGRYRRLHVNDPVLDPRIARHDGDLFLYSLFPEQVTGEKVGPYVLSTAASQIHTHYQIRSEGLAAVEELLTSIGKEIPEGDVARARMLVDMYTMLQADFLASEERKEILKSDGRVGRAAKKRGRVEALLADVGRQLENYEYKDIALEGDWIESTGEFRFSCRLSRDTIGHVLSAPAACKSNVLEQQVDRMKSAYTLVFSHGIGTNDPNVVIFPSLRSSQDPVDLAVCAYVDDPQIRPKWMQRHQFLGFFRFGGLWDFLRMLRKQGPVAALTTSTNGYDYGAAGRMKGIFVAHAIAHRDFKIRAEQRTVSFGQALAETLWERRHNRQAPSTEKAFRDSFHACFKEYGVLSKRLYAYRHEKTTRDFLAKTSVPATHHGRRPVVGRLQTMMQFYKLKHGSEDLIRNKKYAELLALHKVLYHNPHMQSHYY